MQNEMPEGKESNEGENKRITIGFHIYTSGKKIIWFCRVDLTLEIKFHIH